MSFLDDVELTSLAIRQSVFHIVGPGDEHFKLLEAFDAGQHANFFLDRVRSIHSGSRYEFLPDSPVRAQLARIADDRTRFQEESEKLATAFNAAHGGSTAVGAFLVLELACQDQELFALMKFEDEKVLSYDFVKGKSGKPHPTFGALERTFVQNRNALQKAALVRLGSSADEICIVDRQNPARPAAYFEQFLLVRRQRTETQLTEAIINLTRKVAQKHKDELPQGTMKNLAQRLFDASQSDGSIDGEKADEWFKSIVGPLPDDSPALKDFRAELKREGMEGESFVLQKGAVAAPRNRRVETASGVKLTFPASLGSSVIRVDIDRGEITIHDRITIDDVEIERTPRSRS